MSSNAEPADLPVPLYRQNPQKAECVPVCLKMVIDYLNQFKLTERTGVLDASDIANIVKMDNAGTELEDVGFLNENAAITRAAPSVEFEAIEKPREIEDIEKDFGKGLPPIAWLGIGKDPFMWKHAVVIVNVNRQKQLIRYNDPTHGRREQEDLGAFSQKWYAADRYLVRLILGRRENRRLPEFMKRGGKAK